MSVSYTHLENPETGALENFNFVHLLKHVPELKRFNYRISSYQFDPPLCSSDMEPAYWAKLVKIINYNYDYFDGFVILHGTDTMAYTASALSFMLANLSLLCGGLYTGQVNESGSGNVFLIGSAVLPPVGQGGVIVSAGIHHAVLDVVVGQILAVPAAEGELQHLHTQMCIRDRPWPWPGWTHHCRK